MPMRLTLRTMLAYLDDILEPDDSEDIAKKIEESEFATGLMHRTRDCMRRLRLGAPPVAGRGMALDPNTVAEYLDNTLASEKVPDFEKVCLESDMHLAEVAGCHQILTLVLGEPAEIDPVSRERMYKMIVHSAASPARDVAPAIRTPGAATPASTPPPLTPAIDRQPVKRPRPEVPDYLRESKRSRALPILGTLAVAALLTFVCLLFFGPPDVRNRMLAWVGADKQGADAGDDKNAADGGEAGDGKTIDTKANGGEADGAAGQGNAGGAGSDRRGAVEPDGGEPESGLPVDDEPRGKAPTDRLIPPVSDGGDPDDPSAIADDKTPADERDWKLPEAKRSEEEPVMDEGSEPDGGADPSVPPPDPVPAGSGDDARVEPAERAVGASDSIGRYTSDHDVLLLYDKTSNSWRRLPAKAMLAAGDRLMVLPGFRPTVTLTSGIAIQPVGPTLLELAGIDAQNVPVIAVDYGRLILITVGKQKNQIKLHVGDRKALATFADAESILAVDVGLTLVPGMDPATTPAIQSFDKFATSGAIIWKEGNDVSNLTVGDSEQPKWVSPDSQTPVDKRGAGHLDKELSLKRSISLSLKELAQSRLIEVRSLSMRGLPHVGEFELFVRALNDEEQRSTWPTSVEALRTAIALSPETAAEVRSAIEKKRGPEGAELYRMLWGYSSQQLKDGAGVKLADYLNHDSLDYRVVSFWTLQNITNRTDTIYRPQEPASKRKPAVQKWRDRMNKFAPPAAGTAKAAAS